MIKSKKQSFIIIGVFALVLMLGTVTYAFFNYTRTGTANTIRTGRIAFNSSQGTAINLTNMFPIDVSGGIPNDATKVGTVTINVTGDTTYTEGLEYLVSAVNVQNTVGTGASAKTLPISIDVAVASNTGNDPATTLGTSDDDYFSNRGSTTSYYKVLVNDTISTNDQLVVGYIAPGATGVDGNIVIRAYLDASKIAISDTYDESDPGTDNMGTTSEWVDDRTVMTTTEWNSLQTNGVSFQVKVESNEGIWVEEPVVTPEYPTIASCPGCKFIYTENEYFYSANNNNSSPISTLTTFENNNETLVDDYTTLNKNYFLGFKFDGNGVITNAYACGIKGTDYLNDEEQTPGVNAGTAFCIEGSTDGSTWSTNQTFLNDSTTGIWQGRCDDHGSGVRCDGSVRAFAYSGGGVYVEGGGGYCDVHYYGDARCY